MQVAVGHSDLWGFGGNAATIVIPPIESREGCERNEIVW